MRLRSPPGFRPVISRWQRFSTKPHERFALENARQALSSSKVRAPRNSWAAVARVVGDHAGSAIGFMSNLWERDWVDDNGWLDREIGLIIAGNLWDGDQHVQPGNLRTDELMAWLAAHEPAHVQILLGAHDLERLGALGQAPERWLRLARSAAFAALKLPDPDARRRFLAEWVKTRPQHPAPFAAYEHHGDLSSGARLIRRLLLTGRIVLATVARDLHDGRPVLITQSGVTSDTVKKSRVGADAFSIAAVLNRRLQEAVDHVRADWENGGALPLDLGDLYHSWEPLRPSSGLLATRPDFDGVVPLSYNELGLDPPRGARAVSPRQYLLPGLTQIAGHTLRERARSPHPVFTTGPMQSFVSGGTSVISGPEEEIAELYAWTGRLCSCPETACFFTNWTSWTSGIGGAQVPITVAPQHSGEPWTLTVPDPTRPIGKLLEGLITVLATKYQKSHLHIIESFLADCINRLGPCERGASEHSLQTQLEDLHDWIKILEGGPQISAATRLGERWLNAYLTARDGVARPYPPVSSWTVGGV